MPRSYLVFKQKSLAEANTVTTLPSSTEAKIDKKKITLYAYLVGA